MLTDQRPKRLRSAFLLFGVIGACSSGTDFPPDGTEPVLGGVGTERDATAPIDGDGGARDIGPAADAAGTVGDALAADGATAVVQAGDGAGAETDGSPDSGPPACDPTVTWGPPGSVAGLPTGQGATAFTMTPDELTVAWVQPTPGSEGGIQIDVADRAAVDAPFGPAQALTATAAYAASDGLALTPDGLGLVVVRADRMALAQVSRSSRSGTFGDPDESLYQQINAAAVPSKTSMLAPQFTYLGDPVLGQDNLTVMYSGYGGPMGTSGAVSVYESRRSSSQSPFPAMTIEQNMGPLEVVYALAPPTQSVPCGTCGSALDASISGASDAGSEASSALVEGRRHPTGLSSDGRTVFYWDDLPPGESRAAWRAAPLLEFQSSEILWSDWHGIVTNATCTRLYFIQAGEFRLVEISD
jgi:hypothetical protein